MVSNPVFVPSGHLSLIGISLTPFGLHESQFIDNLPVNKSIADWSQLSQLPIHDTFSYFFIPTIEHIEYSAGSSRDFISLIAWHGLFDSVIGVQ